MILPRRADTASFRYIVGKDFSAVPGASGTIDVEEAYSTDPAEVMH